MRRNVRQRIRPVPLHQHDHEPHPPSSPPPASLNDVFRAATEEPRPSPPPPPLFEDEQIEEHKSVRRSREEQAARKRRRVPQGDAALNLNPTQELMLDQLLAHHARKPDRNLYNNERGPAGRVWTMEDEGGAYHDAAQSIEDTLDRLNYYQEKQRKAREEKKQSDPVPPASNDEKYGPPPPGEVIETPLDKWNRAVRAKGFTSRDDLLRLAELQDADDEFRRRAAQAGFFQRQKKRSSGGGYDSSSSSSDDSDSDQEDPNCVSTYRVDEEDKPRQRGSLGPPGGAPLVLQDAMDELVYQCAREEQRIAARRRTYDRYHVATDRNIKALSAGELRYETMLRMPGMIAKAIGWELSSTQAEIIELFTMACANHIYGEDWEAGKVAFFEKHNIGRLEQIVLAMTPRRFGKTTAVSIFIASLLLVVPNCRTTVFAQNGRTSSSIVGYVKDYIVQQDELNALRFARNSRDGLSIVPAEDVDRLSKSQNNSKLKKTDAARKSTLTAVPCDVNGT